MMKVNKTVLGIAILLATVMLLAGNAVMTEGQTNGDRILSILKEEVKPAVSLLPPDVKVQPGFEKGVGPIIGTVQMAQGDALVVHKGQKAAYALQKDHPLFQGDTLVTGEKSRANVMLNDKSVMSLAAYTKLVLDESVYKPETEERSTLLSLLFGRVRCIVNKVSGKSKYEIKTPTAVCGLRGSDFALAVAPDKTKKSAVSRVLAWLNPVKEAHAQMPLLLTALVTGPGTSVSFGGLVGAMQMVGPVSVSAAAAGASALAPITVGAAAAGAALGSVGPGLAAMSMPPGRQ